MANSPDTTRAVVMCAILLALTSSFVAVIIGSVSLSKSSRNIEQVNALGGLTLCAGSTQDKTWTFAVGDFGVNLEYLDDQTNRIRGYNVDVVEAVCRLANRTCVLVWDVNQRCWDSEPGQRARGGEGLMAGWYDACTGWVKTYPRSLTFDFTRAFVKRKDVALYAVNTSTVDYQNLEGLTVGFIDGWASDEHCLTAYGQSGIAGAAIPSANLRHYSTAMKLVQGLQTGQIDVAFAIRLPQLESRFKRLTPDGFPNHCYPDGAGMMTKRGRADFISWWNEAFDRLVGTPEYDEICARLTTEHGHKPGSSAQEVCIGY